MNKQQITNLLGAGTMASLIVGIGLLLGGQPKDIAPEAAAPSIQTAQMTAPVGTDGLQAENIALQEMVTTYQAREAEYAAQVALANEALAQQSVAASYSESEEYEEEEEGEYESEEAESEEAEYEAEHDEDEDEDEYEESEEHEEDDD